MMKILLVDDDPVALKVLSIQLRNLGTGEVEVVCRTGGQAALEVLEQEQDIGLVFCDLQMPGMDGVEFVRHLVHLRYAGGLVLVSGESSRTRQAVEQLAQAHGLQIVGTLGKPVTIEALRRVLDEAVKAGRPRDPILPAPSYAPDELAVAIRQGQLRVHYQPKVSLATGKVMGLEALVRWQHPRDGLVMPDHFVPMSEKHGLVGTLGVEVVREALGDLRRWLEAGHELDLAVNVPFGDGFSLDYPDVLVEQARVAGVPLRHLVLEITESHLMDNPQVQLDVLTRLRLKQVKLSIDDFGTGYSSLAQLRDLPFDELKIDRSFVHHASRSPSLRVMLESSIGMARELGLRTVAEGVEEREDWDLLRSAGCDMVQGYFVARPMPGHEVDGWLPEWGARQAALLAGALHAGGG
ncbi:EAL domain-containing protein [Rhodanobacter sp. FDAARGOS 1247]|uniref:EAL domain-containing response regulator n=1 Tax=Rhodanobacter sp. FDAARGOS 1247 TaxID=2778082 RepID=UPI00194E2595|nr:EAL domain-containing response regulator [Rhodanobacter sp. FDAARGOS 1247]